MSNLVEHAKREMKRAGLGDPDGNYGGALQANILELVEVFAKQGHSGGSASIVIPTLIKLLNFENLTALTSDPEEWIDRSRESGGPLWQNARNSKVFSKNGGKTWTFLAD